MAGPTATFEELVHGLRDAATVTRVFGDPIERDGVTIVPVATVGGGGGAGGGGTESEGGSGGGFRVRTRPVGVYVIKNGEVSWRPAIDRTRIVVGGQLIAVIGILAWRSVARRRAKRGTR
jgi:uncharacterized spore protein YtfJ